MDKEPDRPAPSPLGRLARVDVYDTGIGTRCEVDLADDMTPAELAAVLRDLADGFETGAVTRTG